MLTKLKKYNDALKATQKMLEEPNKLCSIYVRCSTPRQIRTSLTYQNEEVEEYAIKNGFKIVKRYEEGGKTAAYDSRRVFQEIMEDVRNGVEWKYLLVYNDSRFVRNQVDGDSYEALLRSYGIKIIGVSEQFDYDNPKDRKVKKIRRFYNELLLDDISESTFDGLRSQAKKANHCGGLPPLGYDVVNGKLVINAFEAKAVKQIFNLFENNVSLNKIAEKLNEQGFRTKTHERFNKNSFSSILKNEKYAGLFTWNVKTAKDGRGKRNNHKEKALEDQIFVPGGCPAIIEEEQFETVQKMLEERANGTACSKSRHHYALSSKKILKCDKCGAFLVGSMMTTHGQKYRMYQCPNHKKGLCETKDINADILEDFVISNVIESAFKKEDLEELGKAINDNLDEKVLKQKIEDVNHDIKNISKALRKKCSETLLDQLDELEEERNGLVEQLEKSEALKFDFNEESLPAVKDAVFDYLKYSDDLEATKLLKANVSVIVVNNDEVKMEVAV